MNTSCLVEIVDYWPILLLSIDFAIYCNSVYE